VLPNLAIGTFPEILMARRKTQKRQRDGSDLFDIIFKKNGFSDVEEGVISEAK